MAQSKGFTGRGGAVSVSTDGNTFTKIEQVRKVDFGDPKSNFTPTTNFDSPGNVEESLPTTIDNDSCTLEVVSNQQAPGQQLAAGLFYAQTLITVQVQYPPQPGMTKGLVKTFPAYVESNGQPKLDLSTASTFNVKFKIVGVITDTPGA